MSVLSFLNITETDLTTIVGLIALIVLLTKRKNKASLGITIALLVIQLIGHWNTFFKLYVYVKQMIWH